MVEKVLLYDAPTTTVDTPALGEWVEKQTGTPVEIRDRLLEQLNDGDLSRAFAEARVISPYQQTTGNTMLGIIRYEERALENPEKAGGVLYDGRTIQNACNARIPRSESGFDQLHIGLLDRALGTWGGDGRWHKRINILGQPSLISVPGLYEAPAKPEEYYKEKQRHALLSGDAPPREILETQVEGDFLIQDDPRTTDALRGYLLQAYHFVETGEAFCDDPLCCLYNAHHQEELITAQLREPLFCETHAEEYANEIGTTH